MTLKTILYADNLKTNVEFRGDEIGFASTEESPTTLRWTEVVIYRTEQGNYIVHKFGPSRVVHVATSNCSPTAKPVAADQLLEDAQPCPVCKPILDLDHEFVEEIDRSSVHIAETPQEVIAALYTRRDGGTFMSKTAKRALAEAADRDPALKEASVGTLVVS